MFPHLANLLSHFCPFPISPGSQPQPVANLTLPSVLTETCSAGEVSLVEVLVVDGDRLDERGAHAHHGLAVLAPAKKRDIVHVSHTSILNEQIKEEFRFLNPLDHCILRTLSFLCLFKHDYNNSHLGSFLLSG